MKARRKAVEHHTQNDSFKQREAMMGRKNRLKREVMVAQLCEYTENH